MRISEAPALQKLPLKLFRWRSRFNVFPRCSIKFSKCLLVILACFLMTVVFFGSRFSRPPLNLKRHTTQTNDWIFKVVADLDTNSREETVEAFRFKSFLMTGSIHYSPTGDYSIEWKDCVEIYSTFNDGQRGMELSELLFTDAGELLSMDDRTGIVYEHKNVDGISKVFPKFILSSGNGLSDKGMKIEWATKKDGTVWLGSFGKEYTGKSGETVHEDNFWVAAITSGQIKYHNWKTIYNDIRNALGVPWPGYLIIEAVNWSAKKKKWVILPRRVSNDPYDEDLDESKGSNQLVIADEKFQTFEVVLVGEKVPERGFSSFKFLPGSNDEIIVALKSEESKKLNRQLSFLSVFYINGTLLLEDQQVPASYKFEGIEFIPEQLWLKELSGSLNRSWCGRPV